MARRVYLTSGKSAEEVAAKHFSKFSQEDIERLTKETADIIYHGELIADQGGSFKSKRTMRFGDREVILDARFGKLSLLDRLVLFLRF